LSGMQSHCVLGDFVSCVTFFVTLNYTYDAVYFA
jgi:hypothetical protein